LVLAFDGHLFSAVYDFAEGLSSKAVIFTGANVDSSDPFGDAEKPILPSSGDLDETVA
jgi:hypothetical protein